MNWRLLFSSCWNNSADWNINQLACFYIMGIQTLSELMSWSATWSLEKSAMPDQIRIEKWESFMFELRWSEKLVFTQLWMQKTQSIYFQGFWNSLSTSLQNFSAKFQSTAHIGNNKFDQRKCFLENLDVTVFFIISFVLYHVHFKNIFWMSR